MAVRFTKAGTECRVLLDGRFWHGIVTEVTDPDAIRFRLGPAVWDHGHVVDQAATRVAGTARFEVAGGST